MKKLLLIFCLLVVGGGAFADIEPWQFNVHLSEEGWREKLEADIKKYPQVKFLVLYSVKSAIPELPEHDFNNITINFSSTEKDISLAPLAKFKLRRLHLPDGRYRELYRIDRSRLEILSFGSDTAVSEISGLEFPALTHLYLYVSEEVLDLRKMPRLSSLSIQGNADRELSILLAPGVKLKELDIGNVKVKNLPQLDLSELDELDFRADLNGVAELKLPKLRLLYLRHHKMDSEVKLPELPELVALDVFANHAAISLKTVQRNCPKIGLLSLFCKVTDWEVLPTLPLKKLHIGIGMMYELPVNAPAGCVVTGLVPFIENPYKMWKLWAVIAGVFGFIVWCYRRRQKKEAK